MGIAVGDQVINSYEERIHLEKKSGGNYLVIKQAGPADEAEYVCSVSAFILTEIRHDVKIRVRPVILTKPGISAVIEEGESAELSCTAVAGSPPPQLRWRKLLGPLPTGEQTRDGGLLELVAVRRDHVGNYVCEADNGFGNTPVTSLVRVHVEYGPSIKLAKSEDSGTEMEITCIVDSNPPSKIRWLKDGVPLEAELLSNAVSNHEKKQVLRLVDLDHNSFGNYSCLAENKLGKDEAMTKISGWPAEALLTLPNTGDPGEDPLLDITIASDTAVKKFKIVLKAQDNLHWQELLVSAIPSGLSIPHPSFTQ